VSISELSVGSQKLSGSKFQTDGPATKKNARRLNVLSLCHWY